MGEKQGNVTFYINDQNSSLNKNNSNRINNKIDTKMDTMKKICQKYVPNGINIDFCKIDIEGGEKGALLGYDSVNYRPKMFCVESTIPNTRSSNFNLWEDILIKNDYIFVYSGNVNRYYADKRIPELLKRCSNFRQYLNNFKIKRLKRYRKIHRLYNYNIFTQ